MSSHPNRDAPLDVWKFTDNSWTWLCWHPRCDENGTGTHDTHAEALEAALNHCKKATT